MINNTRKPNCLLHKLDLVFTICSSSQAFLPPPAVTVGAWEHFPAQTQGLGGAMEPATPRAVRAPSNRDSAPLRGPLRVTRTLLRSPHCLGLTVPHLLRPQITNLTGLNQRR